MLSFKLFLLDLWDWIKTIGGVLVAVIGIGFTMFLLLSMLMAGVNALRNPALPESALSATGVRATAVVKDIRQTNAFYNYNPQVEVLAEIRREGRPAYDATVTFYVQLIGIPRVQPGQAFAVFVDPDDPSHVEFDDRSQTWGRTF